jgi:hypothetical protein
MQEPEIKELLYEVADIPMNKMTRVNGWVHTTCPLAPWTHEKAKDEKPSFGVKIQNNDTSIFNCFTCRKKGPLSYLVKMLDHYTGNDYATIIEGLETEEFFGADMPEWDRLRINDKQVLGNPLDEEEYDIFEDATGHPYLAEREIDDETARTCGLVLDPDNQGIPRILFPVRGPKGDLYGFTGRATVESNLKSRDYFGLPKACVLLGSHLIRESDKFICVVEGPFDYARFVQYDLPVVAAMHAYLTPQQASILTDFGKPVYTFYDNDKAGGEGVAACEAHLSGHIPVLDIVYPDREVRTADGTWRQVKDPDELYEDEVLAMIDNAELLL